MILSILLLLMIILLFLGMPIAFVISAIGIIGVYTVSGFDPLIGVISSSVYTSVNNFTLSAVPLFIFMAHLISKSKIADELFDALIKWIGHLPGGTGITTVFASAGFGSLSGSSVAATSTLAKIAVPPMVRANYSPAFSAGLVASCSGTLAAMIPPSINLIIYGIQTENSIGKLFMAGILPGILLAICFSIYIIISSIRNNNKIESVYSWSERFKSLKTLWPFILIIALMLTIIYLGIGTPTEAASFGAGATLLIGIFMKRLNFQKIIDALEETTKTSSMIFLMIIGAQLFSYYFALTRAGAIVVEFISTLNMPVWGVLIIIIIFYLIIGMFLEMTGAMLITLPVIYPLIISMGMDPIWFGIFLTILLEIGLITPPVGLSVFVTSQSSDVPVNKVFQGVIPFFFVLMVVSIILIIFPQIVTFLPEQMIK